MYTNSAPVRAVQICNGLGAGNLGDEFMARAFWDFLPENICLDVEIFPNFANQRDSYPSRHRLIPLDWQGNGNPFTELIPGLLVGDTPVTETLGVGWPLRFLAPRLENFHRRSLPVDAVGAGIEPLESKEARELFARSFLAIRSWTVRTPACRQVLLDLGVPDSRVKVGADWAWLYRSRRDLSHWGADVWADLGIDLNQPLLVANVVNEIWRSRSKTKKPLAAALDELRSRHGFQIAFFCNEVRPGEFFDFAAASEVKELMTQPAVIVPNEPYAPEEVLGLMRHATVTVSQRYHFSLESVLAGTVPVNIVRSEKMQGLVEELGLEPAATAGQISTDVLVQHVTSAVENRQSLLAQLDVARKQLEIRAGNNLVFLNLHDEEHRLR